MLSTQDSTLVALTVFFKTTRFLTVTTFNMSSVLNFGERWEEPGLFLVGHGVVPLVLVLIVVMATDTVASSCAPFAFLETFTVKLQTLRFLTVAPKTWRPSSTTHSGAGSALESVRSVSDNRREVVASVVILGSFIKLLLVLRS